jgi:hypothetical protein
MHEKFLKFNEYSDIDGFYLFWKLKVLREELTKETNTIIEVLSYIKIIGSFPNTYINCVLSIFLRSQRNML